jgi:hypothetical protein
MEKSRLKTNRSTQNDAKRRWRFISWQYKYTILLFTVIAGICAVLPVIKYLRRDPDWYQHAWFKCRIPNALAITFDDGPGNVRLYVNRLHFSFPLTMIGV